MERQRVLVIEDDQPIRDWLTYVLNDFGYEATATDSVVGAAALARRLQPCVILLDLGLPYRSGASLLAELKAEPDTMPIPVIVVSAMPEVLTDERRGMAAAVLSKPVQVEALLDAIRAAGRPADRS